MVAETEIVGAINTPPGIDATTIKVVDMHTAGEPVRIVTGGYPLLHGEGLLTRRRDAIARHDHLRRRMMLEPRGHGGMYGVIPMPSTLPGAALSVLFTHAGGYSTMCGHATIAIARWAIESGIVAAQEPETRFVLECPCGPISVHAQVEGGRVTRSGFTSVPAFVERQGAVVDTEFGSVVIDVVYGGAYYVLLRASSLGLDYDRASTAQLADAASALLAHARDSIVLAHPESPDLAFLYGVILTDDSVWPEPTRNICVFGDGQIDRSPTGSGVTARLAHAVIAQGAALDVARTFIGPTGEAFTGMAVGRTVQGDRDAIIARIEGESFYSAFSTLVIETADPLRDGFLLSSEAG